MRAIVHPKVEAGRYHTGPWSSHPLMGNNGMFHVQGPCGMLLRIIASDGARVEPWEHVSVSTEKRVPNWEEMCFVKDLFWTDEECVIQYHPPKSEYVNFHPRTLHLWKPLGFEVPTPPSYMIGPK